MAAGRTMFQSIITGLVGKSDDGVKPKHRPQDDMAAMPQPTAGQKFPCGAIRQKRRQGGAKQPNAS
jgi:hypothetical protein